MSIVMMIPARVEIRSTAARGRADPTALLPTDGGARTGAERGPAGDRTDGARAAREMSPCRRAVKSIESGAAATDGRALLPGNQRADRRTAADDRRGARLSAKPRTMMTVPVAPGHHWTR